MSENVNRHPSGRPPVLIFGITPRSGTNYLTNLLRLHPDAGACPPIWEDYLTHYAAALDAYARQVASRWRGFHEIWNTEIPAGIEDELLASIGEGLLAFLAARCNAPVAVSKTPTVENLDLAPRLFPRARLLVLVRDGRACVESSVRSRLGPQHGNRYDVFTEHWTAGARNILAFRTAFAREQPRYRLVRYEDLVADVGDTLPPLLEFCGLDPAAYDLDRARHMPVRGSSTFGQADLETLPADARGGAHLDWEPKPKTEAFDPVARWAGWAAERHAMFNGIAGEYMKALGYSLEDPATLNGEAE